MRHRGDTVRNVWSEFDAAWQIFSDNLKALRLPDDIEFNLEVGEPQDGISFPDISKSVLQCRDYVDGLASSKSFHSIPSRSINRITTLIEEATAQLKGANSKFEQAANSDGLAKFDSSSLILATADDVTKIDLGATYRSVFERLDNFVYEYSVISHFLKVEGTSGFYFRKQEADRLISQIEKEAHSIVKTREQLNEARELQKQLVAQFRDELDTIESAKASVAENSTQVDTALAELNTKISNTDAAVTQSGATIAQANQLEAQIEGHQKFIGSHQSRLEQLQQDIEGEQTALQSLQEDYAANAEKITQQVSDAESMLQGATIAGLAGEFGKIKSKLEGDLNNARSAVHLSAVFLFISVLPIMAYVFGPSIGLKLNGANFGEGNLVQSLTGLTMRSVLLIPASWFARFSAKRHDRIFRLREHYAYKYSLATAVEGFKKQAPQYEDDIAAETFYELTFNPADKLDQPRVRTRRRESIVLKAIRNRINKENKNEDSNKQ